MTNILHILCCNRNDSLGNHYKMNSCVPKGIEPGSTSIATGWLRTSVRIQVQILTGKYEDVVCAGQEVVPLGVRDEGARRRGRVGLDARRRRAALVALHQVGGNARQLAPRRVGRLREAQLGEQALADHPQAVLARVLVGAAGGTDERLLGAGGVLGGGGRQPRGQQQQARGPGPRPARRAQRTRGAAEREAASAASDVRPRAARATLAAATALRERPARCARAPRPAPPARAALGRRTPSRPCPHALAVGKAPPAQHLQCYNVHNFIPPTSLKFV